MRKDRRINEQLDLFIVLICYEGSKRKRVISVEGVGNEIKE
jgi:hypothetical protein